MEKHEFRLGFWQLCFFALAFVVIWPLAQVEGIVERYRKAER